MYALARGPLVCVCLSIFVTGTAYQFFRFFLLSRKVKSYHQVYPPENRAAVRQVSVFGLTFDSFLKRHFKTPAVTIFQNNVFTAHPVTIGISALYHACLLICPLFLMGHNELIELSLGARLPSFSDKTSDMLSVIVLFGALYFLIRRMALSRLRAISSYADYLVLAIATLPFLTGFLAYHQIFDYQSVMLIHMLSGELMLAAIPFTKLSHMFFFFFNRFLVINEHTVGRGSRVWS